MLIVQKFGGSSVADAEKIERVANIIADTYNEGNDVVVVLSAQGDTTDDLVQKAREINPRATNREMDMLLSVGEQISIALMSMQLQKMRIPAISLTGWQVGVETDSSYGMARIRKVHTERMREELAKNKVVIVAGFQGINKSGDITTLGRGGSDTTAVAIAAVLRADKCQIYTDVEGVFTADPRKVPNAKKLEEITYDEMLELSSLGAQVLHNRSVEMAKRFKVDLEVLSSYVRKPGTKVKEVVKNVEKMKIAGIAKDTNVARVTVVGLTDEPGAAYKVFQVMGKAKINVDVILQSMGREGTNDISFTVPQKLGETALSELAAYKDSIGFDHVSLDTTVAKVSIVGTGMMDSAGIASMMFEALYETSINIQMISTSEIKVSVLIDESRADDAVAAIHAKFF
ncbi:MAG: aspartate kinase [Oscillospiraceae bacterium]|nr:aspartate kinase [Oscillospiraceae bacterium]MCD8099444.1 aspartate kinase [Oscillospiraceae bacterium]MCD8192060.1 aspartate kinase [Oscillospiraceae bacterium]